MDRDSDEISNSTLFDKIPQPLKYKLNRLVELLNILLILNEENFEEKSNTLLDSEFYHKIDMYEMFINISLNICFFWPKKIPMITRLFTTFHKKDENSKSMVTKRIITNQILHGYFNNPRDDVYTFLLYLILYGIQYHDISRSELINDIKQNFTRKKQFANQLTMIFLYFAPEIKAEDSDFYDQMKSYTEKCREKGLLCSKTLKFLDNLEYYKSNNWEMLIKNRINLDCANPILHSFLFDDLDLFKKTLHLDGELDSESSPSINSSLKTDLEQYIIMDNIDDETMIDEDKIINAYFNNPPLSLFTLFDIPFPLISIAVGFGAKNIFKYLYEKGALLDQPVETGATIVQLACMNPVEEILNTLQNENLNLMTGMTNFVRCFDIFKFKEYCHRFLGRDYEDFFNNDESEPYSFQYVMSPTKSTVLVQSVLTNNYIAFKMCLENRLIDINEPDGYNLTPLDIACQMGNKLIVEILVELGADFNRSNPLINAAMCGHSEIVKYILSITDDEYYEDVQSCNKNPIAHEDDYLFLFSHHECNNTDVKIPLNLINKADSKGVTPLYASITNSHYKVTRMLLLTKKIDLTKRFKDGLTYINLASGQNNVDILQLVLEYVPIPFDEHDVSPLATAIASGMINSFLYLLNKKRDQIDLNKMFKSADVSALWMAIKFSHPAIVSALIEKENCKVTAVEIDLATRNNDIEILSILNKYFNVEVKEKGDLDQEDNSSSDNEYANNDSAEYEEESGSEAIVDNFVSHKKSVIFS